MRILLMMILVAWSTLAAADDGVDWAYWRGPNGNSTTPERSWRSAAISGTPKILWKKTLGNGWSAVSVKGDRAYTMGNINDEDIVYCLDANTGRELWRYVYACDDGNFSGPRATPVIDEGNVYTFSRAGHVFCLDATAGTVKWRRNVVEELQAGDLTWGFASSPVIAGRSVLLNAGPRGVALDKQTGETIWHSGPGKGNYAALVPARVAGKPTILSFGEQAIYGVDPANGKARWSVEWITKHNVHAADPLPLGDKVWISSGYDRGCALLDCSRAKPGIVWENKNVCAHFSSPVLHNGYIYAISGNTGRKGQLVCQEPETGKAVWSEEVGFASLILAGDRLIVFNEKGTLRVVEPSPKGYRELARAEDLLPDKCWTAPTLSRSRLYLRNSKGTVLCLDLS